MSIAIYVYSPSITRPEITELSLVERAHLVAEEIAAVKSTCNVFLGPEYLFALDTKHLPDYCTPCSYEEAGEVRTILEDASASAPAMLIVPGTIFFVNGSYDPRAFNVAFAYVGGRAIKEVSKTAHAGDPNFAAHGGHTYFATPDNEATGCFDWNQRRVCLQICTDMSLCPPEACDLALHPAYIPGGAVLLTREHEHQSKQHFISDGSGHAFSWPIIAKSKHHNGTRFVLD